ncbi:hypothetical protein N665_0388s0011 [Sinapis alba]|nr:hypothetical protein N665_0388s0011 [Sinapis alba]
MEKTPSFGSSASSGARVDGYSALPPLYHCSRMTKTTKAWTDDNPGRRFNRCTVHGFFSWADLEDPCGWQKLSLIEARDQIRRQQLEIRQLKEKLREGNQQILQQEEATNGTSCVAISMDDKALEITRLQVELLNASDREKMLKQFLLISWGGFLAITTIIVATLKG